MLASQIQDRETVFLYGDDDIVINTEYLTDVSLKLFQIPHIPSYHTEKRKRQIYFCWSDILIFVDIQPHISVIFVSAAINYR